MAAQVDERIELRRGDITTLEVDAIVNAANPQLAPGGGVCGAIHRAAGPRLAEACARIGGCPTGEARMTDGFDLAADKVIHAVGPVWSGGDAGEAEQLAACYRNSLELARGAKLRSIAFPAISTGVYGFPLEPAVRIAVETVRDWLAATPDAGGIERVIFCLFDAKAERAYRDALGRTG